MGRRRGCELANSFKVRVTSRTTQREIAEQAQAAHDAGYEAISTEQCKALFGESYWYHLPAGVRSVT